MKRARLRRSSVLDLLCFMYPFLESLHLSYRLGGVDFVPHGFAALGAVYCHSSRKTVALALLCHISESLASSIIHIRISSRISRVMTRSQSHLSSVPCYQLFVFRASESYIHSWRFKLRPVSDVPP